MVRRVTIYEDSKGVRWNTKAEAESSEKRIQDEAKLDQEVELIASTIEQHISNLNKMPSLKAENLADELEYALENYRNIEVSIDGD
jgi:hypothetical protein